MPEETVEIILGGQKFTLRSSEGANKLREYADYANAKLSEVTEGNDSLYRRETLLALLNITEELFSERARHHELLRKIEGRAEKIQEYLNSLDATE